MRHPTALSRDAEAENQSCSSKNKTDTLAAAGHERTLFKTEDRTLMTTSLTTDSRGDQHLGLETLEQIKRKPGLFFM